MNAAAKGAEHPLSTLVRVQCILGYYQ